MSTLKRELTKRYTWRTRLDLELAVLTYVGWYNTKRKHRSLRVVEDAGSGCCRPYKCSSATIRKPPR